MLYLYYENSFDGFLTAVFDAFCLRRTDIHLLSDNAEPPLLFECRNVPFDSEKSQRVQNGISQKLGDGTLRLIWTAWLSHKSGIEDTLLKYLRLAFRLGTDISKMPQNDTVLKTTAAAKRVTTEATRFKEIVRFKKYKGIYFADIYPDCEILPLIAGHFADRFSHQNFIIRDRRYGKALIYYNGQTAITDMTEFDDPDDMMEDDFEDMWKKYYHAMCIESRKSRRRLLSVMPLKYHRYMTEMQQPVIKSREAEKTNSTDVHLR